MLGLGGFEFRIRGLGVLGFWDLGVGSVVSDLAAAPWLRVKGLGFEVLFCALS